MKRLLFSGGGGAATEALDRLLRDRYVVHFTDADSLAKPPTIDKERWHVIPPARVVHGLNNPAFVPTLAALCDELGVDVLVPGVDEELRQVAYPSLERRASFRCDVLLPSFDVVARHLDKLVSMRSLAAAGIPVPVTARLRPRKGEIDWPEFPCVVKPREGRGSRHVAMVRSANEGEAHLVLSRLDPADVITQELLVGQEYTVTMVANRAKRLRAVVPVRVDLKRGITVRAATVHDAAVTDACRRIHAADPFAGCVNVQVIQTDTGVKPFEINPRVSTTTCLAIAAGVDVIGLYLDEATTEDLAPFGHVTLRRTWQTEFACAS